MMKQFTDVAGLQFDEAVLKELEQSADPYANPGSNFRQNFLWGALGWDSRKILEGAQLHESVLNRVKDPKSDYNPDNIQHLLAA